MPIRREVTGYEGLYEVDDQGSVYSLRLGRKLKPAPDEYGYPLVVLTRNKKRRTRRVHLLVIEAFHGARPDGMVARHVNGDNTDNRAVNLAWGTPSQNVLDQVEHGTHHCARKTHCPQGHEYSAENTYVYRGLRGCRRCHADREAARRVSNKT